MGVVAPNAQGQRLPALGVPAMAAFPPGLEHGGVALFAQAVGGGERHGLPGGQVQGIPLDQSLARIRKIAGL